MAVGETDCQGVQPPARKPQPVQNHHSFHLAHTPGRKGRPWSDLNKGEKKKKEKEKKMFPNCWVKPGLARMGRMRPRPAHLNQYFPFAHGLAVVLHTAVILENPCGTAVQGRLSFFGSGPPMHPALCQVLWGS